MPIRIVAFSGSLSTPSRSRALAKLALTQTVERFGGVGVTHDLLGCQPSLGQTARLDDLAPPARGIVTSILEADALILATPVYKGSYPGLFKHLFDLIDPGALTGKPVLLMAAGGGDKHGLMIEHQLRPLLGFFEAACLPTGIYAGNSDFCDGISSEALRTRLDRAVDQFAPFLGQIRAATAA